MNPDFYEIAYRTHLFANPVSPATLDRVLEAADLRAGERAADLGCGRGGVSFHLAESYGLAVDGVDMSQAMLAGAETRLSAQPPARGSVALHLIKAEDFLQTAERPYDLLVAMGATQLAAAAGDPTAFFTGLRRHLTSGGRLLYADPFWRRPPSEALGAVTARYSAHADYIRAGEAAGLVPEHASESPLEDWDDYAWRMARNVRDWARGQPPGPARSAVEAQARFMLDTYLGETRERMGFGLYLFRAP